MHGSSASSIRTRSANLPRCSQAPSLQWLNHGVSHTDAWQWNCRGYRKKLSHLQQLVQKLEADPQVTEPASNVIALQETSTLSTFPGYVAYYQLDMPASPCTSTLVHSSLTSVQHELKATGIHHTSVEILPCNHIGKWLFVLNVYSSVREKAADFSRLFTEMIAHPPPFRFGKSPFIIKWRDNDTTTLAVFRLPLSLHFYSYRTVEISLAGCSAYKHLTLGDRGTLQGAILSPFLVNLAMCTVPSSLDGISCLCHTIYANDVTLWTATGSDGEIEETLQPAADAVVSHATQAGLTCSESKSELLLLRPPNHSRNKYPPLPAV
ncbi:hypothetical protein HPB51_027088 [Rhipicephalus microplus]|uniref:Tick transposon n=1 Tax=Rhipicephalus microplus TaxID=6941 RepID=A0A9J6D0U1_RHIMP|nr:hypothetical protein HPB51_027088 [Rhipicephalus microplus]